MRICRRLALAVLFACIAHPALAQWEFVGPGYFYPEGIAETSEYVFLGAARGNGRTPSTSGGKVYRSADGGRTWDDVTGAMVTAQQPVGPKITALGAADGLVVLGTREDFQTVHIYASADDGATWTRYTGLPEIAEGFRHMTVVDASTVVAVGKPRSRTALALYVSTDAGATWTMREAEVPDLPVVAVGTTLAMGRSLVNQGSPTQTGYWISEDLGETWTMRPHTTGASGSGLVSWNDGAVLYQFFAGGFNQPTAIYRTDDLGQTYTSTAPDFSGTGVSGFDYAASRGDRIVAKGFVRSRPREGGGTRIVDEQVIVASADGGATWQETDADSVIVRSYGPISSSGVEVGIGMASTSAGFLHGLDTGIRTLATALYFSEQGDDWAPTDAHGFGRQLGHVAALGETLVMMENEGDSRGGGFYRSTTGEAWRYVAALDAGQTTLVGCADSAVRGTLASVGAVLVAVCENDVFQSIDGLTFNSVGPTPTAKPKMLVRDLTDPDGTLLLVTWDSSLGDAGGQRATFYRSADAGLTWSELATQQRLTRRPTLVGDRLAFAETGKVYTSTDGGQTITATTLGNFASGVVDATATPTAFFAGNPAQGFFAANALHRSTDNGQTWTDLVAEGALADGPSALHTIGRRGDRVVAVFADSVAISEDDGATWASLSEGWPTGSISEAAFVLRDTLYLQMYGSGLYRAALSDFPGLTPTAIEAADASAPLGLDLYPNPARGAATVRVAPGQAQRVHVTLYDLLGRHLATLHDGTMASDGSTLTLGTDVLAPGVYLVRAATDGGAVTTRRLVVVR